MKILNVNHLLDPVSGGGTAERTVQLARFLKQQGTETAILTLDIGETKPYEQQLTQIPIFKLPCINRRYYVHASWPRQIHKIVAQFDVIHLMGHWTLLNAIVALVCVRLKKPYVVCPAGSLKAYGRSTRLKRLYDLLIGRWLIKHAHAWIAITEDEKQDFLAYGIAPQSVKVISNGIDPTQYQLTDPIASLPPRLEEIMGRHPYLLFLGRLHWIKGPDLLLEAFISVADQFPDVHLLFAGPDAGMLQTLQGMSADSDVYEKIHFLGYVGGRDKVSLLNGAISLVIPSRNEAMSVVVLEAGICSVPVIFTDRCGLNDLAQADAGYMVEVDAADISRGLAQVLSNPQDRQRIAGNLGDIIKRDYLWINKARQYQDIYKALLHDH